MKIALKISGRREIRCRRVTLAIRIELVDLKQISINKSFIKGVVVL